MKQAKQGDTVRINYTGKLDDGTVFDTTLEMEDCHDACGCDSDCDSDDHGDDCGCGETGPYELTVGGGEFFPAFEEALVGMAPGERRTITILAADGFGEYDEERLFTVDRSELPEDLVPEVGDELVLTGEDDEQVGVTVAKVDADSVTFDANHPLAGENLTFEIELLEIL